MAEPHHHLRMVFLPVLPDGAALEGSPISRAAQSRQQAAPASRSGQWRRIAADSIAMGCAASSGAAPPADAAWAATGALGSDGRAADAPLLRRSRPLPAEPEPEPEPELEPAEPQIALGDLEQLCLLGVGSFGVVSLVRHRHSGKTFGERMSLRRCCEIAQLTGNEMQPSAQTLFAYASA
jgi:hypothetical protein